MAATIGGVIECSPPMTTGNLPRLTISEATRRISWMTSSMRAEGEFHLRQRENADAVDVGSGLFVPQLHVRRSHQDLVRPVPRAGDVGRRPIERDGQDDDAGAIEIGGGGRRAAEFTDGDTVVLKRQAHSLPRSGRAGRSGHRSSSRRMRGRTTGFLRFASSGGAVPASARREKGQGDAWRRPGR